MPRGYQMIRKKHELLILAQYYFVAILSSICVEIMIFCSILSNEHEINFAGYFHKNVYGRWFGLSVFFIIFGLVRFLYVLATSEADAKKEKSKKAEEGSGLNE